MSPLDAIQPNLNRIQRKEEDEGAGVTKSVGARQSQQVLQSLRNNTLRMLVKFVARMSAESEGRS